VAVTAILSQIVAPPENVRLFVLRACDRTIIEEPPCRQKPRQEKSPPPGGHLLLQTQSGVAKKINYHLTRFTNVRFTKRP
jgi:hypothetical protein